MIRRALNGIIFKSRWLLYPVNIGLLVVLTLYVAQFLYNDYYFIRHDFVWGTELEPLMVLLLGFVDASMVANLIIMIVQGGHHIFINRFERCQKCDDIPQYLAHIDPGLLKVKVALSIAGITLVQILKDFVNIEHVAWSDVTHRIIIHVVALLSALTMSVIWRVTHPEGSHD